MRKIIIAEIPIATEKWQESFQVGASDIQLTLTESEETGQLGISIDNDNGDGGEKIIISFNRGFYSVRHFEHGKSLPYKLEK